MVKRCATIPLWCVAGVLDQDELTLTNAIKLVSALTHPSKRGRQVNDKGLERDVFDIFFHGNLVVVFQQFRGWIGD